MREHIVPLIGILLVQCGAFLPVGPIASLKKCPRRAGVKLVLVFLPAELTLEIFCYTAHGLPDRLVSLVHLHQL